MIVETDNLVSASGFARRKGISKTRAHLLIKAGRLPIITIDDKVFIDMSRANYEKGSVPTKSIKRIGYFKAARRKALPYEQKPHDSRTCIA